MQASYDHWQRSAHRNMACAKCHGSALTLDAAFHLDNARRAGLAPAGGELPERDPLRSTSDVCSHDRSAARAATAQEFAAWQAGPHSATYDAHLPRPEAQHASAC